MPTQIIEFPFDSGQYEAADREWLPPNLLAECSNLRLDLDGRLGIRPGFTALGTTTYSPTVMVAYDVCNYNGRLIALGDQTTPGFGRATDVFEYVNGVAAWRGCSAEDDGFSSGPRFPRATAARELGRVADLTNSVTSVRVAAGAGFVCEVINVGTTACRVHVFNPTTDQTIILVERPIHHAHVVFAGTDFWIVGQTGSTNVVAYNFDPLTDETLAGPVTISAAPAGTVTDLSAAQTGATDWSVVWAQSTTTTSHRVNSAGTVQATWSVAGGDFRALGICGNSGGTLISVLSQRGADGTYRLNTYNAAGVLQVGPTTVFGGAAGTGNARAGLCQSGTLLHMLGFEDDAPTTNILTQLVTSQAAHTLGSVVRFADAIPTANAVALGAGAQTNFYYGAQNAMATNIASGTDTLGGSAGPRGTNMLVESAQRLPQCYKDGTLAPFFVTSNEQINTCAVIGTKIYWGNQVLSNAGGAKAQVTELEMSDPGRRQMSVVANEVQIAGAMPLVYDGRIVVESGLAERPAVQLTAGTTGSLQLLGVYSVLVVWALTDSRNLIVQSAPSLAQTVTLTGAQDSIDIVASTPHSLRVHPLLRTANGLSMTVNVFRTTASGANFILDQQIAVSTAEFGEPVSVTLTRSDAALTSQGFVVYTQAQTPLAHVSPAPYRYTWPARERQLIGGLPDGEQWQFSKLLFPSEPVEFSTLGRLGFFGRANKDITAVGAFETVGVTWTSDEIAIIPGFGPDHSGVGEFDGAIVVPSPGGCRDWRSLVSAPPGFFFQMAEDKLMLLARGQQGAGEVSWIGQPVRTTLAAFPVITGAVHIRTQMAVVFSCTNVAGNDGRLLVYDLRRNLWYVDTVGPVSAVAELNGRLVILQAGLVSQQNAAVGVGTFPGAAVQTGFQPVTKRLGWGHIYRVGLLGGDTGACSIQALIDVDDGTGLRDLGTEVFTGAGQTFERFWSLPTAAQKAARYSVRFVVTSASPSAGPALKAWAIEVEGSKNMTRVGSGGYVA